jgi:hypothetical protein
MPDLMVVIDGTPVALAECGWVQREKCGCIVSATVAVAGTRVIATAEQAEKDLFPNARSRAKNTREGRTWDLITMAHYRQDIGAKWECSEHATPARPNCGCGAPIPAGRTAYCSVACRLTDMDHGSDIELTEEAA